LRAVGMPRWVALHPWHGVDEATWLEEKEMEEELKKEELARRKEEAKELERRRFCTFSFAVVSCSDFLAPSNVSN